MVQKLIDWSLANPFIVILLGVALAIVGGVSFWRVNVEAYPDPAPAIIEVVAQFPGASAEEVERQVTIPLELALAGMPGLESTRSKSLFGLAHLRNQFDYSRDYDQAKQDVINRLSQAVLPAGVNPQISPASPCFTALPSSSTILNSASGTAFPTLPGRFSLGTFSATTGLVSVNPYPSSSGTPKRSRNPSRTDGGSGSPPLIMA